MDRPTAFLLGATVRFPGGTETTIFGLELSEDPWTLVNVLVETGFPVRDLRRIPRLDSLRLEGERIVADVEHGSLEPLPRHAGHHPLALARFDRGTRIQLSAPEEPAATVFVRFAGVVAEPDSGVVRSFVGNESGWLTRLVRVPPQPSTRQSPEWLWVRLEPGMLGRLPAFQDDRETRDQALEAIAITGASLDALQIRVIDGRVEIRGVSRSDRERLRLRRSVAAVAGVRDVESHLVTDPELEIAVASALRDAGLDRPRPPLVHSRLGVVQVSGGLPADAWARVREVVDRVDGVRETVLPADAPAPAAPGPAPAPESRNGMSAEAEKDREQSPPGAQVAS